MLKNGTSLLNAFIFNACFLTITGIYLDQRNKNQIMYEGWNFNSGNYLFTTDTK